MLSENHCSIDRRRLVDGISFVCEKKEEREEEWEIRKIEDSKTHTFSPLGKEEQRRTKFFVVTHNLFLIATWDSGVIK